MEPKRWECPSCGMGVTMYVELVEPPVCHNKHLRRGHVMKQVDLQSAPRRRRSGEPVRTGDIHARTCRKCGQGFRSEPKSGRPPVVCPSCR